MGGEEDADRQADARLAVGVGFTTGQRELLLGAHGLHFADGVAAGHAACQNLVEECPEGHLCGEDPLAAA